MHYAYILYSRKLKKFYIGKTDDLSKRFSEHNKGLTPFTACGVPWELVHYQAFLEKEDASREELFLKTGKGRERRKYLLKSFLEKSNI
jgi:putative endonuclease